MGGLAVCFHLLMVLMVMKTAAVAIEAQVEPGAWPVVVETEIDRTHLEKVASTPW